MVSFAVQAHKEQAILASMERSAHVSVEQPAPNGDADHPG
jgi:hypothetical protein